MYGGLSLTWHAFSTRLATNRDSHIEASWCLTFEEYAGRNTRNWIGEFELCKTTDEPVPWSCVQDKIQAPTHRTSQPASEEAYDRIKSWYDTCRDCHDACNERAVGVGPSRLLFIDDKSSGVADVVRLVKCDEGVPPSYVALSHCWGTSNHLQTTLDNLDGHTAGIEVSSLSRTFRDAIAICQHLGESYLWIDSLCIVQDDHQGKAVEIEKMQSIYEGASLTISAMSARDGRGGCWIPRERVFEIPVDDIQSAELIFRRVLGTPLEHASFLTEFPDDILHSEYPLATRKWALQERLLSQRLIHLTASELVWECQMNTSCECKILDDMNPGFSTHQRVREALRRPSEDRHELIFEWMKLLESYSRGELTRETDALPAIAGLANKFSHKNLGEYFAGMWFEEVPMTLCWFSRPPDEGVTDNERPLTYVAPSWSWASVRGPLCFDAWDDFGTDYIARAQRKESDREERDGDGLEIVASLVSICLDRDPFDGTQFGRINHGVLSISTVICVVGPHSVLKNRILGFEGGEFMPDTFDVIPFAKECVVALIFVRSCEWSKDDDDDEVMSGGDFDAARNTWRGQAFVLVESEDDDDDANDDNTERDMRNFRRCGLLCVSEKSLGLFGQEEVVLNIV
ncbi:hypothetical protein Q7P35_004577 [Cladosporium inversicolor]